MFGINFVCLLFFSFVLILPVASGAGVFCQQVVDPDSFSNQRDKFLVRKNINDTFIFDDARLFYKNKSLVKFGNNWRVLDKNGKLWQSFDFSDVKNFAYDLVAVKNDSLWALMNFSYKILTEFKYDSIIIQSADCVIVKIKDKYGVLNSNGKESLKVIYDHIFSYHNNLIWVKARNKWGLFDVRGINISGFAFDEVLPIVTSSCFAKQDGKWVLVNNRGKKVIGLVGFDEVINFYQGYAVVKKLSKSKLIDSNGKYVHIRSPYVDITYPYDGVVWARNIDKNKKYKEWFIIDIYKNKEYRTNVILDQVFSFWGSSSVVASGPKLALINKIGEFQTKFDFYQILPANISGYFWVMDMGSRNYRLIDGSGKGIDFGIKFRDIPHFLGRLAVAYNGSYFGIIRLDGKIIVPLIFDAIIPIVDERGFAKINNKWALISSSGSFLKCILQ